MNRRILSAAIGLAMLAAATPAWADGDVVCKSGPQSGWQPVEKLRKKAWLEGWQVRKTQVEGDCYEIYATTDTGMSVEAFFHPVTLEKLVVFRRGKEIYRKKGFTG